MNRKPFAGLLLLAGLSACNMGAGHKTGAVREDILYADIDTTVNPADNFFEYANGGWIRRNPIPGDETGWGIGNLVEEELYKRKLAINEEAVKKGGSGINRQIGDFWYSAMDTNSIEKMSLQPLKPELDQIAAAKTPADVMRITAQLHTYGTGVFFGEGAGQDLKNSDQMSYYISQGGLGMPNRDYYYNTDPRTTKIRQAYPAYVRRMLVLSGVDSTQSASRADAVIKMEFALAEKSRKLEDLRDPYTNYHKYAIGQLTTLSPNIDWPGVLKAIGVHSIDSVIVGQPEFITRLGQVLQTTPVPVLQDYLTFHLLTDFAPYLSKPFDQAHFEFYSQLIRGAKAQRPRWKRVLDAEEHAIGEGLGQLFAKEYFDGKAKKRYEDMVENVRVAYKERMEKLDWMTDSTRKKALTKLSGITKKVGYPDKWKDFSAMKIDRGPFVRNIIHANEWANKYQLDKLGKPVDRKEWDMTPQTYNAYYNPSNNEIVLPAGIFTVPGYRDEQLDDALVYGYAAASTIGHEITHGFDDEGRQYDEKGNLKNWWSKADEAQFGSRAQVLVKQFNGFMPVDTLHINGKSTLGENLADLGGILIGLDAFKKTDAYKKGEKINGLTPLQRFFLGYSLGWMYAVRDEQLASRLLTDVHSPAKYRVNGPFPNVPEFYEAFNVKPGNKMYLADSQRVRLW